MKKPFGIVSGNGLGLANTTHRIIGDGPVETTPFGGGKIKSYANLAEGNLIIETPLLELDEVGEKLAFYFTYNSQAPAAQSWRFNWQKQLITPGANNSVLQLLEGDGSTITYTQDPARSNLYFANQVGEGTPFMRFDDTTNRWRKYDPKTHVAEHYDVKGRLVSRETVEGHVSTFEYDANGRLIALNAASGARYVFEWQPQGMTLSCIEKGEKTALRLYAFDNQGRLTQETFPRTNYSLTYNYVDVTPILRNVTQTDGTTMDFNYDRRNPDVSQWKINTLQYGTFNGNRIDYSDFPHVKIFDAFQNRLEYLLDAQNLIAQVKLPVGYEGVTAQNKFDITQYTYENGALKTQTQPDGSQLAYTYDPIYCLKKSRVGPAQEKREWHYQPGGDRPLLFTQVDYPDPDDAKSVLVNRFVYEKLDEAGHAFLRFSLKPSGSTTEYRPDDRFCIASERTYLDDTFNLSGQMPDTVPAYSFMQAWVAEQDASRVSLTEYERNFRGQPVFKRDYTDIDNTGKGIANDTMQETLRGWTILGDCTLESKRLDAQTKATTTHDFDDLRRETQRIDPLQHKWRWEYQDAQQMLVVTQPNGRQDAQLFDWQMLVSHTSATVMEGIEKQVRETRYRRDNNGMPLITLPPTLETSAATVPRIHQFFDRQYRLGYNVSPSGIVTEVRFNAATRSTMHVLYEKPIDIKELYLSWPPQPGSMPYTQLLVGQLPKELGAKNRVILDTNTQSGKLRYHIDSDDNANRFLTEIVYDNLDRPIATINYKEKLTNAEWQLALKGETINRKPDPTIDRIHQTFYDNDHRKIGEQDAAGYITEYTRNAGGRIKKQKRYGNKMPINVAFKNVMPKPVPNPTEDADTYYFYDAKGQITVEIDPKGHYITRAYLACGLLKRETRYATPIDPSWFTHPTVPPPVPLINREDQTTVYDYDLLEREISQVTSDHHAVNTDYDVMGNTTLHEEDDLLRGDILNPDVYRSTHSRFDGWGQLSAQANVYISNKFAQIDADPNLSPEQKAAAKEKIWLTNSLRHTYDTTGLKLKTTDPLGHFTYYYYDQERRPIISINARGTITEITPNSFNNTVKTRKYKQTISSDQLSKLTGGFITLEFRQQLNTLQNDLVDAISTVDWSNRDLPATIIDANKNITRKAYNAFKECEIEQLPVNGPQPSLTIQHEFETRGKEIRTSKIAGDLISTTTRRFDNLYALETDRIDAEQGRQQKIYDPSGTMKETINALGASKTYQHDAFSRQTAETNELGETTLTDYNQQERTKTITPPIAGTQTVLKHTIFAETILKTDGLQNSESFQHDPGGKITQYTDPLGNITQDTYNDNGWHQSHIDANQIETTFQQNEVGSLVQKTDDVNGLNLTTNYKRDSWERDSEVRDPRGILCEREFDCKDNVIKSIVDPGHLNITVKQTFNASNHVASKITGDVATPNAFEQTFLRDGLDRAVGDVTDPGGLAITNNERVNKNDDVIAHVDPNGNITREFYNLQRQKRFEVSAKGGVTEWQYDEAGYESCKRFYERGVDPKNITDKTTLAELQARVKTNSEDTVLWTFHDKNHRPRFTVTGRGIVNEKCYDGVDNVVETVGYYTRIDPVLLPTLTTDQLIAFMQTKQDLKRDRHQYTVFNARKQARFLIDAEKIITEQRFDTMGRIIGKIVYSTPITDPAAIAKLPVDQVLSHITRDPVNDRATFDVFDSRGLPLFNVIPLDEKNWAVIGYLHDENNNLTQVCEFKQTITVSDNYDDLVNLLKAWLPDPQIDRITKTRWDAANRKSEITDPMNASDHYQYNACNKEIMHLDRMNESWETHYDRAMRETIKITPEITTTQIMADGNGKLMATELKERIRQIKMLDATSNETAFTEQGEKVWDTRTVKVQFDACNKTASSLIQQVAVDDPTKPPSFSARPEKVINVVTQVKRNVKNQVVAEQNEDGIWKFIVRDADGQEIYHVQQTDAVHGIGKVTYFERDAFSDVEKQIDYDTPTDLDLSLYTETGIPLALLEQHIKTSPMDRVTIYTRDRRGDPILTQRGPVFYYIPTGDNTPPHLGFAYQQTIEIHNAFRERVRTQNLIDPIDNTWTDDIIWNNKQGKLLAEVQLLDITAKTYRLKRYDVTVYGEEEERREYKDPIQAGAIPITSNMSVAQLDQLITPANKPRICRKKYNLCGSLTDDTRIGVVVQQREDKNGKPNFKDLPPQNLNTHYDYDAMQRQTVITDANGNPKFMYHDALSNLVAETGVPRTDLNGNNIVPLTHYGVNGHRERVMILHYASGTKDPVANVIPTPIHVDPENDQCNLSLTDKRGLEVIKQDPEGEPQGFTYPARRDKDKKACKWQKITNLQGKPEDKELTQATHIDSQRWQYDALFKLIGMQYLRDNAVNVLLSKQIFRNIFSEDMGEGPGDGSMPIVRKRDPQGLVWYSNEVGQVPTLHARNLALQETMQLQSATDNLDAPDYQNLPNIAAQTDITRFEHTENMLDASGRVSIKWLPAYYDDDMGQPQNIPLNMLANGDYMSPWRMKNGLRNDTSLLSWPVPQERNRIAETLVIWPVDHQAVSRVLEIHTQDNRCFVHLPSDMASDQYDYQIHYFLNNPVTNKMDTEPTDMSTGRVQVVTDKMTGSYHLVTVVEKESVVRLTGNTQHMKAIELWQGETKIASNVSVGFYDIETQSFLVDLSTFETDQHTPIASGEYTLKPIYTDNTIGESSLPFVVYTATPSLQPLSREITCAITLETLDNHGQLTWTVPAEFAKQTVNVTLEYQNSAGVVYTQSDTVLTPGQYNHDYPDRNGKILKSNITFAVNVAKIDKVTLSLNVENNQQKTPEWALLLNQIPPDITPLVEPDVISTNTFAPRLIVYLMSFPVQSAEVDMQFLDTSHDRAASWKVMKCFATTQNTLFGSGVTADVSGLAAGIYPVLFNGIKGEWRITWGGAIYAPTKTPTLKAVRYHPHVITQYDVWDNPILETDENGNTKQYEINNNNQVKKTILPVVEVMAADGSVSNQVITLEEAYDMLGHHFGTRKGKGNVELKDLDNAGQQRAQIIGDGTVTRRQLFNALGQVASYQDARGNVWIQQFNRSNKIVLLIAPSGLRRYFIYNERQDRITVVDPAGNAWYYGFDPARHVTCRMTPDQEITLLQVDRHGHVHQQEDAKGTLVWLLSYSGVMLAMKDLANNWTHFDHDWKQQVTRQYADRGDGTMVRFIKYTQVVIDYLGGAAQPLIVDYYRPYRVNTPAQDLRFAYLTGRLKSVFDAAQQMVTEYGFTLRGDRVRTRVSLSNGVLLQDAARRLDSHNRDSWDFDSGFTLVSYYDANDNRGINYSVLNTGISTTTQVFYSASDEADRAVVVNGTLQNGVITIAPGIGQEYGYAGDLRVSEVHIDSGGKVLSTSLVHNVDGQLINTSTSDGSNSTRQYHPAGYVAHYEENKPVKPNHTTRDILCTGAGYLVQDDQTSDGQRSISRNGEFVSGGYPATLDVDYYTDGQHLQDQLRISYKLTQTLQEERVGGIRIDQNGASGYNSCERTYDANNTLNGQLGAVDSSRSDYQDRTQVFLATYDGKVLLKFDLATSIYQTPIRETPDVIISRYYQSVTGQLLSSCQISSNPLVIYNRIDLSYYTAGNQSNAHPSYTISADGSIHYRGNNVGFNGKVLPAKHFDQYRLTQGPQSVNGIHLTDSSNPPPVAARYTVMEGDTYPSIAQKLFGDESFAQSIAKINGDSSENTPSVGTSIEIPPLEEVHNGANNFEPYAIFISTIVGSLYPHLIGKTKTHHHAWWKEVIEVVVGVALAVLLPEIFGPLLAVLGPIFSSIAVAAASAAVDDAVVQGVAIGFGDQQHFSLKDVGIAGAEGGLTAGVSELGAAKNAATMSRLQRLGNQLQQTAKVAVATQLANMAMGKHQFDFSAVASAMSAVLINSNIDAELKSSMERDVLNLATSNFLEESFSKNGFNIQQFAMTAIGAFTGQEIGVGIVRKIDHYRYQSSLNNSPQRTTTTAANSATLPPESNPYPKGNGGVDVSETTTDGRRRLQRWKTNAAAGTNNKWGGQDWKKDAMDTDKMMLNATMQHASSNPNLVQGFTQGTWIDKQTGAGYVETTHGLERIAKGGIEAVDPEMWLLPSTGVLKAGKAALALEESFGRLASRFGLWGRGGTEDVEALSTSSAFNGKVYPANKMKQLVGYLERRGVSVYGTTDDPAFIVRKDGQGTMILLPENPTALQVKHELSHYLDYKKMGFEAYKDMGRPAREASVLNRLQNNRIWNELNEAEREFSIEYVDRLQSHSMEFSR